MNHLCSNHNMQWKKIPGILQVVGSSDLSDHKNKEKLHAYKDSADVWSLIYLFY